MRHAGSAVPCIFSACGRQLVDKKWLRNHALANVVSQAIVAAAQVLLLWRLAVAG
jgi:hypothetical protein